MTKGYKQYRGNRPGNRRSRWPKVLLCLFLACVVAFGALFGCVLAGDRDEIRGQPGAMIILGCQVMSSGVPSVLLKDRLDTALEYWQDHPDMIVVTSGGMGYNEPVSEARCMADYLMERGVPEENILLEDRSFSTYENLRFSMELLAAEGYDTTGEVMVVSNGFHLARVRMLWGRVGSGELSVLAAPSSHQPSKIRMYIREPFALVKSFLLDWR